MPTTKTLSILLQKSTNHILPCKPHKPILCSICNRCVVMIHGVLKCDIHNFALQILMNAAVSLECATTESAPTRPVATCAPVREVTSPAPTAPDALVGTTRTFPYSCSLVCFLSRRLTKQLTSGRPRILLHHCFL